MSLYIRLGRMLRRRYPMILRAAAMAVLAIACSVTAVPAFGEEDFVVSRLWGSNGELWRPESRLPDFSFAGYRRGEEPYRIPKESISVKTFGAVGDGVKDDTESFRRALEAGKGKLILIPAGRYVLNDLFRIAVSGTVLRGEGPDKTVLEFRKPGIEIDPRPSRTDGGQSTSNWSWAGGMIAVGRGPLNLSQEIRVIGDAPRGSQRLKPASMPFRPGDEIVLTLRDDADRSLVKYLYRDQTGNISGLNNWRVVQVFRVRMVEGDEIVLDRPLRFDVRARWQPSIARFTPSVTDVGIENIGFEFPVTRYEGHFREIGYNPVEIARSAAHCWLKNVTIRNADSGPYVFGFFCTVEGIRLLADEERLSSQGGYAGHHGISLQGNDCLCKDFAVETRFIHDLTVQSSIGCVFSRGKAVDLCMDHHRWASYENLFTDIDAGRGGRLFASGGGGNRGNHSGAGATFWNIRSEQSVPWPNWQMDAINIVGVRIKEPLKIVPQLPDPSDLKARWLEAVEPERLRPANLYEAMKARRLARERAP